MPLMYRTTLGAFEQLDRNIINAARTLGVSEWKIFFGSTKEISPVVTQTMSTAIYAAVQANDYDLAFQGTILLVIFSLLFVFAINSYQGFFKR